MRDWASSAPPNNIEAERSLLGAMMLNPDAVYAAIETLGQNSKRFYVPAHQIIFSAMLDLVRANQPVDTVLLMEALTRSGKLEAVGGVSYLTDLSSAVPTSAYADHYASLVRDSANLRELIRISERVGMQAFARDIPWREIVSEAEKGMFDIINSARSEATAHVSALSKAALTEMIAQVETPGQAVGIKTGYKRIDELTGGLVKGDMVVLAARPSVGKTALALNVAIETCRAGNGVLLFSLEMAKNSLLKRLIASVSGVDVKQLSAGYAPKDSLPKLRAAAEEIDKFPLWINDQASIPMIELKAKALQAAAHNQVDLIIIDYLQLVKPPRRSESMQVEISEISLSIKQLAREANCPVLALSQLSRGVEHRDGVPRLSDLRGSGSIEQDADVVMLLSKNAEAHDVINGYIAKQRNGPTGGFKLFFDRNSQRIRNLATNVEPPPPQQSEPEAEEDDAEYYEETLF